jgi:hypothetical protein
MTKTVEIACVNVHEAPLEMNCNTLGWREPNLTNFVLMTVLARITHNTAL